jgi:hypothetical protein
MRPEKTFNVGLYNAILEPKHYRAMGDSLWLYTYLLDRQGRSLDKDGLGKVAGGVPIRDSDVAGSLGCSRRTVIRWREVLLRHGYITATRTPYGYVYRITKPKKWGEKTPDSPETDVTQTAHLSPKTDVTQTVRPSLRDVQDPVKRCAGTCTNKEEMSGDVKREKGESLSVLDSEMEQNVWGYYIENVKPESTYSFTPSRKEMLALRYREMISSGKTRREAFTHLGEAIFALSEDDYHMGRKKKYEGRFQNDFKDIFGTQEVFEKWCSTYQANEKAGRA